MPRPSNTASRRAEIIDGLMRLMATDGYQGASVQSIAKQCGLNPGLLHYHFNSKQEILVALFDQLSSKYYAAYTQNIESRPGQQLTSGDKLSCFVEEILAYRSMGSVESAAMSHILAEAAFNKVLKERVQVWLARLKNELASLILELARSNQLALSTRRAERMASTAMATFTGALQLQALDESNVDKMVVASQIKAFFVIRLGLQ